MQTLCWKPLTFWDEEQIALIQREEWGISKYNKISTCELKNKFNELDLEIWDLELDIHYHEEEIRDLESKKEEKEEELNYMKEALKQRE